MAEAVNLGWSTVAGDAAGSIADKLEDRQFRAAVVDRLDAALESESKARRVLASPGFRSWMADSGSNLDEHLSFEQLDALGVADDETSAAIGAAIGQAIAAVAFERADWVQRELLKRAVDLDEISIAQLLFLQDIWDAISQLAEGAGPSRPVYFGIPSVTAHFWGRELELQTLTMSLSKPASSPASHVINGLGGVGKTQLAARLLREQLSRYAIVAWLDASADLDGQLASLGGVLGFNGEPLDVADNVRRFLGSTSESCLVVLDNLDDVGQVSAFQSSPSVRVLVTTRLSEALVSGLGPVLKVNVFDRATSTEYLVNRTGDDPTEANKLAHSLGDLPLALAHAATYCRLNGTLLTQYSDLLSELPAPELFRDRLDEFYEKVVHETWSASIARMSLFSQRLLRVASYLDPSGVPVESGAWLLGQPLSTAGQHALREAAGELVRWSLADWTMDRNLTVHRLLQKVVRDADPDNLAFEAASTFFVSICQFDPTDPSRWLEAQAALRHAVPILQSAPKGTTGLESLVAIAATQCSNYLYYSGQHALGLVLGRVLADFVAEHMGRSHPFVLVVLGNYAGHLSRAGETGESIVLKQMILRERRAALGEEHEDTEMAWANLAVDYSKTGRVTEAIEIEERIVQIRTSRLGENDPGTLQAWTNLAASYQQAGRSGDAIRILERVCALHRDSLGEDHPNTLRTASALGSSYQSAGRTADAVALKEVVAAKREYVLGVEHPDTLESLSNLGSTYLFAQRFADAASVLERASRGQREVLGAENPHTLRTLRSLAIARKELQNPGEQLDAEPQ